MQPSLCEAWGFTNLVLDNGSFLGNHHMSRPVVLAQQNCFYVTESTAHIALKAIALIFGQKLSNFVPPWINSKGEKCKAFYEK